jgi:MoaA/NifB/PqqE/SkfB family radical SAM enzyme
MKYIGADKILAHLDRVQGWRDGRKPAPINIEWDLSNRCSRGCSFCHFAYTHTRGPLTGAHKPTGATSGGDLADPGMIVRALGEVAAAGVQGVVWTGGGEPTLHPQFDAIAERAGALGLAQGMYTHGGHIDAQRAALIKQAFAWVVVSLDRADETSYQAYKGRGFAASCDGIRRLAAAAGPCTVGVSFLLDGTSWHDAPRMLELARSLGATYTTFRPMIEFDVHAPGALIDDRSWITEAEPMLRAFAAMPDVECDPDRFLMTRDWHGRSYRVCRGIRYNTTITPDGRVWVCPNRREFPGSSLGDLSVESFADVWARHPGQWTDFADCRAMCRLHLLNVTLDAIETPRLHPSFV